MDSVPRNVKLSTIQKAIFDHEADRGISLEVPSTLRGAIREELIAVMTEPDYESFLKILVEEFGFVILNLTLLKSQRLKIDGIETLPPSRNYRPLIWHKDGGIKHFAPFSLLFTDTSGPRRLSRTAISEVSDVFPSLVESCNAIISRLKQKNNSREVVRAWQKVLRKLNAILVCTESPAASRQLDIRIAMEHFLNALDLSIVGEFLDFEDYTNIIADSLRVAGNRAYIHQWEKQQTVIVSSQREFIHCRMPASQESGGKGGVLFAKAARRKSHSR